MLGSFYNKFEMLSKPNYYYPRGGMGVVKTRYKAKLSSAKLVNWNWNLALQKSDGVYPKRGVDAHPTQKKVGLKILASSYI